MSKIGKKPIKIPKEVNINISGQEVSITGPKGMLFQRIKPGITINQKEDTLVLGNNNQKDTALLGLYRSLLANMVQGVTTGWSKGLELKGVGFRAQVLNDKLTLMIGFTHPVEFLIPKDITINVNENKIIISGIDKQLVGETAAKIRHFRPPEPYKGKGIRYIGEKVRKKLGKQAVKVVGAGGQ